jgi:8-oxo-dGTP pyrophosphatase MutT (NUDIX family)
LSSLTPDESHNPWTTVSVVNSYSNAWITVEHHEVIRPDGLPGVYGKVHFHNQAVAIVPIDADMNTWLVGQYRYTTNNYSWEVPEGGVPFGEDLAAGALRELKEETGLSADVLTDLGSFHLSNSVTDEVAFVFLATGLFEGEAEPEGTEQLAIKKVPFAEALGMADDGLISDSFSLLALYRVERWLRTNKTFG